MILVWYLLATAAVISFSSVYHCNINETCNVNCTGLATNSNQIPTQCTNLTIDALTASSLTVSCANNSYCDSMKILAPICGDECGLYELNCFINCIGDVNVCNNIQIYTNNSVSLIKCGVETRKYGTACSNGKIYGLQGPGATYFQCRNNTECNSISIHNYDTTSITMSNEGIMNDLNITAPFAKSVTFNQILIGHVYNNCIVENRFGAMPTAMNTASFINSEFYLNALVYTNRNGLDFHDNKIHCLSTLKATFTGSARIYNNMFFADNSISIQIEHKVQFDSNNIFANYSESFHVYMAGINASISNNNIYAQHAKSIDFEVADPRDSIHGNSFYLSNAENVTFNIYGKFFANKIYGKHLKKFELLCLFDQTVCGSDADQYFLSNAYSVLLQAGSGSSGAGGIIDGGYFDVSNVSKLQVFSYFGFMRNMNVNAKFADNVNVTMYSGQLYNSTIDSSMSNSLTVWCNSFGYWHYMNNTNCNELTLKVPPLIDGTNDHKASLLCDGIGCENLILYTINGAEDINITGVDCNCRNLYSNDVNCVVEWEIYCDGDSTPSVLSSAKKCEGVCCDNVVDELNFEDLNHCNSGNDNTGMAAVYYVIIIWIVVIVVLCGIWWTVKCHKRNKKNDKKEPLLIQ